MVNNVVYGSQASHFTMVIMFYHDMYGCTIVFLLLYEPPSFLKPWYFGYGSTTVYLYHPTNHLGFKTMAFWV